MRDYCGRNKIVIIGAVAEITHASQTTPQLWEAHPFIHPFICAGDETVTGFTERKAERSGSPAVLSRAFRRRSPDHVNDQFHGLDEEEGH